MNGRIKTFIPPQRDIDTLANRAAHIHGELFARVTASQAFQLVRQRETLAHTTLAKKKERDERRTRVHALMNGR